MRLLYALFTLALVLSTYSDRSCNITSSHSVLNAGDPLEINCTWYELQKETPFGFFTDRMDLSPFCKLNPKNNTNTLWIKNTTEFAGVTFFHCGPGREIACIKLVVIGYPPVRPENINCVSHNLKDMVCYWDKVKDETDLKIPTNWTLKYRIGDVARERKGRLRDQNVITYYRCQNISLVFSTNCDFVANTPCNYTVQKNSANVNCPQPGESGSSSCLWPTKDSNDPRMAFKPLQDYRITVTATNILNNTSSDEVYVVPSEIVKPDKVGVTYHNATDILIVTIPNGIENIKEFEYKIEATCKTWQDEKPIRLIGTRKSKHEIQTNLSGLIAHSNYTIGCSIKPKGNGFWSDQTNYTITTPEKAPEVSPTMVSFTQSVLSANKRRLDVYWKSPDPRYCNGFITEYRMIVNSAHANWTVNTSVLRPPITYRDLNISDTYDVWLAALTSVGCGPYTNPVRLTPLSQSFPVPADVIAESLVDDNGVRLSWTKPARSNIEGYRVVYCDGWIERPVDVFIANCEKGEMKVENLDVLALSGDDTLVYNMSVKVGRDTVFGVSIVDRDGDSGGITWAECLSNPHKEPNQMREVSLKDIQETSVVVEWSKMSCDVQIAGYQISYWSVSGARKGCDDGIKQDFHGASKTRGVLVRDLNPSTNYRFCARAISTSGRHSIWSEMVSGETKTPVPFTIISVCTVIGFLVVIILILVLCVYKFVNSKIPMEDTPDPEIELEQTYTNNRDYDVVYQQVDGESASSSRTPLIDKRRNRDSGHESMSRNSESSNDDSSHNLIATKSEVKNLTKGRVTTVMAEQANSTGYVLHTNRHGDESGLRTPRNSDTGEITPIWHRGEIEAQRRDLSVHFSNSSAQPCTDLNKSYVKTTTKSFTTYEPNSPSNNAAKLVTEPQLQGGYVLSIDIHHQPYDEQHHGIQTDLVNVEGANSGVIVNPCDQTEDCARFTTQADSSCNNEDVLTTTHIQTSPTTGVDSYTKFNVESSEVTQNTDMLPSMANRAACYHSGFAGCEKTYSPNNVNLVGSSGYSHPECVGVEDNTRDDDTYFHVVSATDDSRTCDAQPNCSSENGTSSSSSGIGPYRRLNEYPNPNTANNSLNFGAEIGLYSRFGTHLNTNTTPNTISQTGPYVPFETYLPPGATSNSGSEIGSYSRFGTQQNINSDGTPSSGMDLSHQRISTESPDRINSNQKRTFSYSTADPRAPLESRSKSGYHKETENFQFSTFPEYVPQILGIGGSVDSESEDCKYKMKSSDNQRQALDYQDRFSYPQEYHSRPLQGRPHEEKMKRHYTIQLHSDPSYSRFADTVNSLVNGIPVETGNNPQQNVNSNNANTPRVKVSEMDDLHFDDDARDSCDGDTVGPGQVTIGQIEMTSHERIYDNVDAANEEDSVWERRSLSNSDDEFCIRETVL